MKKLTVLILTAAILAFCVAPMASADDDRNSAYKEIIDYALESDGAYSEQAAYELELLFDSDAMGLVNAMAEYPDEDISSAASLLAYGKSYYDIYEFAASVKKLLETADSKEKAVLETIIEAINGYCDRNLIKAESTKVKFVDVPANIFYAYAVDWAVEKNITNGVDATHFAPDANCTRAQAVTFLWRALGCPEPTNTESKFSDVTDANGFYYKAVLWAAENGVTNGIGGGKFGVNDTVNRAQMVTFMARAINGKATTSGSFTDVPEGAYYADAASWAKENWISNGIGDKNVRKR